MRSPEAAPERHSELSSEPWKALGFRTRRRRSCFPGRCHAITAFKAAGRPWSSEGNQVSSLGKLQSGFRGRCNMPTAFEAASVFWSRKNTRFRAWGSCCPAFRAGATTNGLQSRLLPWSSEGNQASNLEKLRSGFRSRCNLLTAFKAASFQTRGAAAPVPMKHGAT